ncbi:MAG TPA: glycosyl hydrolase family 28-related protein [Candidatus Saccharimonadales bacterium]|nr:glycosyl hydrolase family 28-related protein [Candidatus Saccharimonadales bacterium]
MPIDPKPGGTDILDRSGNGMGVDLDSGEAFILGDEPISVKDPHFGAVGDGVTDDIAAFVAAIAALGDRGGTLYVPKGYYRLSQTLVLTKNVKIVGEGWTQNPGIVGGISYAAPLYYYGSILIFDQNVTGLQFYAYTDNLANATAYEFQSSYNSVLQDIMLYGGGGTSSTAHGIETRTLIQLDNVRIENFSGDGFRMIAYTAGANPYGNASLSMISKVDSASNKGHGFYIEGPDANVCTLIACNAIGNGGVGFLDKSLLGNFYMGCHANNNNNTYGTVSATRARVEADAPLLASSHNNGSYVTINGGGAENAYFGCYTEIGSGSLAELNGNSNVYGGTLSEPGSHTAASVGAYKFLGDLTLNKPANPTLTMIGAGTYAIFRMKGDGNLANGLEILAGSAAAYFSADTIVHRNAAQSVTYGTWSGGGLNLGSGKTLSVNGTQVVTSRQTGTPADATDLASALTLVNALKAKLITHGLIS